MWSVQTAYPQPQGAETCNVVVLPSDKLCHLVVENLFILLSHRLEDVGVHEHRSKAATSRDRCLTDGLNFLWVYSALNRHRGKGQQKVTVEHVHVHAGGQAVVGMVEARGGGDGGRSEEQPQAKQIAHAPQPAMRSPDKEREPVPVTSDAERPLPNAWRDVPRRSEG